MSLYKAYELIELAYDTVSSIYSIKDAVDWAGDFHFPLEAIKADSHKLREMGYNLPAFIRWKQSCVPHSRLSVERLLSRWNREDPDFVLLLEIARDGVKVMTSRNFVPQRVAPSRFSPNYHTASTAVNKLIYESYLTNLAVIIPTADLTLISPKVPIHQSRLGLTLKKGKPQGRVTCNYSYGKPPSVLNTDEVREMAREYYGDIKNTTLYLLVLMILQQVDRAISLGKTSKDLVLWNMVA